MELTGIAATPATLACDELLMRHIRTGLAESIRDEAVVARLNRRDPWPGRALSRIGQRQLGNRRCRLVAILLLALLSSADALGRQAQSALPAQQAQSERESLPTLTTARAAHSLSSEEAARRYPVRLRAVVTYYDPYIDLRHAALFVHDSTGGIFVFGPKAPIPSLHAGSIVKVEGFSGPGDFAPVIVEPRIGVVGESPLPPNPPRMSLTHLSTGAEDGQWVEVECIVRSVVESSPNVTIDAATSDGAIRIFTLKEDGKDYAGLVDAKVLIHANVAPWFNAKRQITGVRLFTPGLAEIKVEEPAPADPFSLPLRPINSLFRFGPDAASGPGGA